MNAFKREPVLTRLLNPNASEASYKPKQRSYRKIKLIFFFSGGFYPGTDGKLSLVASHACLKATRHYAASVGVNQSKTPIQDAININYLEKKTSSPNLGLQKYMRNKPQCLNKCNTARLAISSIKF